MLLIVGLGNPGEKYDKTRHNTGFIFLDELYKKLLDAQVYTVKQWKLEAKFEGWVAEISNGRKKIFLLKPNTFMNLSGVAVEKFLKWYKDEKDVKAVIVFDDLDLPLGTFKIQDNKFPRGHKGVNSILKKLPAMIFTSVRIGTDNRNSEEKLEKDPKWGEEFILKPMSKKELTELERAINDAIIELRKKFSDSIEG